MTRDRLVYRCTECDRLIGSDEPRFLTDFGWTHPTCMPLDSIPTS